MIYPEFPGEGSVIGICAPSSGIGFKEEYFDLSLETLCESGYDVFETESVRNEECPSAPPRVRGEEFNSLFADDDIAMVMSAAGGDFNMEMLPYIDEELVRSHPKWFAGYSDPTAIELYMTTVLDIATIYGVNAGAWDWRPLHKFQYDALSVISGDLPVQYSYDFWCSNGFNEELGEFEMDAPVEWTLLRGSSDADDYDLHEEYILDVSGRLIGGCIDVINWAFGTPFEDFKGFTERYREDGFIWFFDNFILDPMTLMYSMERFKQMGLFEDARAVVFGRTCFTGEATDIDYLEKLERVFGNMDLPVIWNADIGHTKPSFTIINGAIGHLTYGHGTAVLTMEMK